MSGVVTLATCVMGERVEKSCGSYLVEPSRRTQCSSHEYRLGKTTLSLPFG